MKPEQIKSALRSFPDHSIIHDVIKRQPDFIRKSMTIGELEHCNILEVIDYEYISDCFECTDGLIPAYVQFLILSLIDEHWLSAETIRDLANGLDGFAEVLEQDVVFTEEHSDMKERIELTDSLQDVCIKMSDGNPGALACIMEIIKQAKEIDPQDAMSPMGPILMLESYGIYGSPIYVIWSDKCGRDTRKMLMLLRATQLGMFSHERLKAMADDQMREVNLTTEEFDELDKQVCDRLDEFKRPEHHEQEV